MQRSLAFAREWPGLHSMKVAIIGAGFSGLAAAMSLVDAGIDTEVWEARDRVGGRVWSQQLVPGDDHTVVERGAEFVLSGYERLTWWVDRLGLALADTTMSYYVREPRGGAPTDQQAMASVAAAFEAAVRRDPTPRSLAALAASLDTDPAATAAFLSRVAISCAAPIDELSARSVLDVASGFDAIPTYRVSGGNQGIAIRMAAELGDRVHTGAPVQRVRHDSEHVHLDLADGGSITADHVIITVPLVLLREFEFAPAVPAWKSDAWARTGVGHAAKLHASIADSLPASAVLAVSDTFWTWVATDASGRSQPVAHCFSGSWPALDGLGVADGGQRWLGLLEQVRPELTFTGHHLLTTWADDPWARMAYSADSVGQRPDDHVALALSVGRLHFAGEHTGGGYSALMEGALRSGERAAHEVIAASD